MKNISVFKHIELNIPEVKEFTHFCIDAGTGDILGYSNNSVYKLSVNSGETERFLSLEELGHLITCFDLIGININSVTQELCLVFASGDILSVEYYSKEAECVGSVESGIRAVQWSPDQEMIVLITGKDTIITMTGSFDPLNEVDFYDENFGEKQFITVGWGKKETQFHGSEGKVAAKVVDKSVIPLGDDDGIPRVSWRGDGNLFCVSLLQRDNTRRIKIFSREGILQYTSEYIPSLEVSLAWRPSGSLIASTQTLPNKHQVVFFEKNGLRHGEFTLPFQPQQVCVPWLSWNCDSDVLAVLSKNKSSSQSILQLWTCSNYHWYLKQSMPFHNVESQMKVRWDDEINLRLHILLQGARYICFDFMWDIDHSSIHCCDADVAVIDGDKLLLTSFWNTIIPPPLCGEILTLPAAINRVIFSPHTSQNLCVILCDDNVAIFRKGKEKNAHTMVLIGPVSWECEMPQVYCHLSMYHWLWLTEDQLVSSVSTGHTSLLLSIHVNSDRNIVLRRLLNVSGNIVSLRSVCTKPAALIQLSDGQLLKYIPGVNRVEQFEKSLPETCPVILTTTIDNLDYVLGLSNRGTLYSISEGNKLLVVSSGITSMFVLPKFLLMTTAQNTLCCLKMENHNSLANVQHQKGDRRIERGSQIVVAIDTRIVLQMPRGNLETVTPRTLVLHVAAQHLDDSDYSAAFQLFRKQRINLNLLFDHSPKKFLSNVDHFVNNLQNPTWLSLFLSELSNEDVTQTMYANSYLGEKPRKTFDNKVSLVCDQVREAIKRRNDASLYLFPVLTSYVRKNEEEDLAAALKEAKAAEHFSVDEALKYLFYIVDVNAMYDIALGLYDFDLLTLVASKSTKDPKEYLPFLNELRRLEPNYQKYTIDKHLKRYKSALCHLSKCPDHFDECLELIRTHKMFTQALELFNASSEFYGMVAEAYADHLMTENKFHEAGLMYERSKKLEKALDAYKKSLDWQEASIVLCQLSCSEVEEADFWRCFVTDLTSNRCFVDAARILQDILNDVEETVAVLSQGHHWLEAVMVAYQNKRLDLLETHVKPGVMDHKEYLINQLYNANKSFMAYKTRLAVVREEKSKQTQFFEDADQEMGIQHDNELYSDTSSIAASSLRTSRTDSKASLRSGRSSKNRRKLQRKLLSLKEGSAHEDLALIQALHQQITLCLNMKDDVRALCKILLRFNRDADAVGLQCLLDSVLCEMQRSVDEIWSADLSSQPAMNFGPDATANSIVCSMNVGASSGINLNLLEPHVRYPPTMVGSQWKLQVLENSA